ncbi:hypothetical protein [Bacillus paralicheniformis]|uniref:hypothetical protein n=1 Tax=Bacillus paralicheniformis TaxID=1648923 RepID=UPI00186B6469|nr:hypothetical protein [Bacillus paralicheniformis]
MIELKLTPSQPIGLSTMSMAFSILTAADREPYGSWKGTASWRALLRSVCEADSAAAFFI